MAVKASVMGLFTQSRFVSEDLVKPATSPPTPPCWATQTCWRTCYGHVATSRMESAAPIRGRNIVPHQSENRRVARAVRFDEMASQVMSAQRL